MTRLFVCLLVLASSMTTRIAAADNAQASSQSKSTRTQSTPTKPLNPQPAQAPMMPLVAPLFVSNAEVSSTLTVVNAAAVPASADIILDDQQGIQLAKETLRLSGHTEQTIEIADLLAKAHSTAWIGSVELMPDPKSAMNMSVVAQLSLVSKNPSEPAYLEEEFLMPSNMSSNVYHAAASSVLGRPALALKSTSMQPQTVTVTCISERGGSRSRAIQLASNEMVLTPGCDVGNQHTLAFEDFWHQPERDTKGAVGLSVTTTAMPGELNVYGFAQRGTSEHPAFTALNFSDSGVLHSSNTVFTGVPVGEVHLLPGDSFRPEIALANFGPSVARVQVLYAVTGDDGPNSKVVADVSIPPQSSSTVQLPALDGDPKMRSSFIVQSSVAPGSLAANLTAIGGPQFPTVQLIGKDQQQTQNGGSHPWTLENSAASTLLLFNPSSSNNRVDVRIAADGKLWLHRYRLDPLETKAISIGDLVASGVKGDNGQVLAKEAKSGEVNWSTEAGGEGFGRLLVSQPLVSLARNFSCGNQVQACSSYLSNGSIGFSDPGSASMGPLVVEFCVSATACTGQNDYSSSENSSWGSYNTNVASVPGGPSSYGTITAVSPGSTNIFASANMNGCQAESTGTANITASISLNNQLISTQAPGSIVIGQQATLTVNTGTAQLSKASWTVGGSTVKTWNPGPAPPAPDFTQNSPVFYWVPGIYNASKMPTSWSVPVSVNATLTNGTNTTASANVTVLAPSVSVAPSTSNAVYLLNNGSSIGAACGNGGLPTYCMQLTPSVSSPPGVSGAYQWVQVVDGDGYTYTNTAGQTHSCNLNQSLPALDTANPYPGSTNTYFQDSPNTSIPSSSVKSLTISNSFSAVLMWQPSLSNSIWVPVSATNWNWGATVSLNGGAWAVTSSSVPNNAPSNPQLQYGGYWPEWSSLVKGGSVTFTCQ